MKHSTLNVLSVLSSLKVAVLHQGFPSHVAYSLYAPSYELIPANKTFTFRSMPYFMASTVLLFAILLGGIAKAQDVPDASLSGSGVLQLPTDQPLSGSYYFDLSQYSFGSDDEMIGFLSTKSADHFIVRALPDLHKGIVMLDAEFYPSWTVADWNVYLNTATTLNPILPGAPNPSND